MHANEVPSDPALVRRLLRDQFPLWAGLPILPPLKTGTDNAIYRLGERLAVRLPRRPSGGRAREWLPALAAQLPLEVPVPLARGRPAAGFPLAWEVVPWVEGRSVELGRLADPKECARTLAGFLRALRGAAAKGPLATSRGAALSQQDARVGACVRELGARIDGARVSRIWEAALRAPPYAGPPVWVHADLSPGNLIERGGQLVGVIDFELAARGDPAADLLVAWNLFRGESRAAFREALGLDAATWERGRGWALYSAVIAIPYYWETNRPLVERSLRVLRELSAEA